MAAKKKPVKKEKPEVEIPKDRAEAAEFVRRVGTLKIDISAIVAQAEAKILAIQKEVERATAGSREEMVALVEGLFVFFEINSKDLTANGARRSVNLSTGVIGERLSPWKAEIKGTEDVLAALRKMGLLEFIRTREEVNKEAMLATEENRELASGVSGVNIVREDAFFVNPNGFGDVDITTLRKITIEKKNA